MTPLELELLERLEDCVGQLESLAKEQHPMISPRSRRYTSVWRAIPVITRARQALKGTPAIDGEQAAPGCYQGGDTASHSALDDWT